MTREPVDVGTWTAARGPGLLRLAFALTGEAADAEEVVVDALSHALTRWGRLSRTGDPEEPVRRLVLAAHRAQSRRLGRLPAGGTPVGAIPGGAPALEPGEERTRVRAACRALGARDRAVVVLRHVEGLTWAGVADLAGAREGVVRGRAERGLALLRRELDAPAEEDALTRRLREALPPDDDELPPAPGLADAARRRLRGRRRRRAGLAAAALAALALPAAVVGALAAYDGGADGDGEPRPARPSGSPPPPDGHADADAPEVGPDGRPAGYRWETWHRLQLAVPDEWGYASDRYCGPPGGADAPPVIDRPGGAPPRLGCGVGAGSYGIQFADVNAFGNRQLPSEPGGRIEPGERYPYPAGSSVADAQLGDDAVRVVTRSRTELRAVLDSVRRVAIQDVHGCPVRSARAVPPAGEGVSVCRYDAEGLLVQAERLDGSRALGALASLDAAPVLDEPPCGARSPAERLDGRVLMRYGGTGVVVDLTGPECRWGVRADGEPRRGLTPEVLYWALSPGWSGPVAEGVVLPDPLRSSAERPPAR